MNWYVTLSNDLSFNEESFNHIENVKKLTPWLRLLDYVENNNLKIKTITLWDSDTQIRLYSIGKLSSKEPDSIDFRRRFISEGMVSNVPQEISGIVITKDSVIFGVWYNPLKKEVFTTIE